MSGAWSHDNSGPQIGTLAASFHPAAQTAQGRIPVTQIAKIVIVLAVRSAFCRKRFRSSDMHFLAGESGPDIAEPPD